MIVRELVTKLGFKVDESSLRRYDRSLKKTKGMADQVGRSLRKVGAGLTAFVSLPLFAAGGFSIQAAGEFEQLNVAMETMLGSAEKADELIKDLFSFAAKTPFEIKGIQKSAKSLLAVGFAQEKVIPTLEALGNVSAGLGVDLERLILNYGQVRTQTKLTGTELRDFLRAGVPLLGELAKIIGKSESEIKDMVSAGKIGFDDVEKAFMNMSSEGGRFFNLMDKQSQTFLGEWSNLKDQITLVSIEIGKVLLPFAKEFVKLIQGWVEVFSKLDSRTKKIIIAIGGLLAVLGPLLLVVGQIMVSFVAMKVFFAFFGVVFLKVAAIIGVVVAALAALYVIIDDVVTYFEGGESVIIPFFKKQFPFLNEMGDKWKEIKGFLSDVFLVFKNDLIPILNMIGKIGLYVWESTFLTPLKAVFSAVKGLINLMAELSNSTAFKIASSIAGTVIPGYGLIDSIQGRAEQIRSNQPVLGPISQGASGQNNEFKMSQKIEINVETGADPEKIGSEIKKQTASYFNRELRKAGTFIEAPEEFA